MRGRARQLHARHAVAHRSGRLFLALRAAPVELLPGREVLELHAERQPHLVEELLDLVERLAAEVLRLEHFLLALLHELADVLDVGVLQAVGRADRQFEVVDRAVEVLVGRDVVPLVSARRGRGLSKLTKIESWSCRMRAAYATASSGLPLPSVCTS